MVLRAGRNRFVAARRFLHVGTRGGQLIDNASNGTNPQLISRCRDRIARRLVELLVNGGAAPNEMSGTVNFSTLPATINYVVPIATFLPMRLFFGARTATSLPADATVIGDSQGLHVAARSGSR